MARVLLATVLACAIASDVTATLSCYGEDGHAVDWYVMYKIPEHSEHAGGGHGSIVDEGLGYVQITSKDPNKPWKMSKKSMADPTSTPGRTLAPLYDPKNNGNILKVCQGLLCT